MAKVTSKGQVTIPVKIRRALEIEPGDELRFALESDGAHVQVIKQARLGELYASLPASRGFPGKEATRAEVARFLAQPGKQHDDR